MGNTASGNKGCFIKPKKAWRLLKTADEGNVTAYIFGVSGSGKTTLVSRYLGTRKYMVVDAGGIRPDDLVVESSNARKIIVIDNLHELSWGDVDTVREQIIELIRREDVWVILVGRCPVPGSPMAFCCKISRRILCGGQQAAYVQSGGYKEVC